MGDYVGVVIGVVGDDLYVVDFGEQFCCLWIEVFNYYLVLFEVVFQGVLYDVGLFVDFFEYEVLVFVFVGGFGVFVVLYGFVLYVVVLDILQVYVVVMDFGDIVFFQVDEVVGYLVQCQLVGSEEVFVKFEVDYQWVVVVSGDDVVWLCCVDYCQVIGFV